MEQRRNQAGRLFAAGTMILAAIAGELKVSRQSVSRWYAGWRRNGAAALRGAGRAGRKPKLERKQLQQVEKALRGVLGRTVSTRICGRCRGWRR